MPATALKTGYIYDLGEPRKVKFAAISASASETVVAAVAGKKIRVLSYVLTGDDAVVAKWTSDDGESGTDISGELNFAATGSVVAAAFSPVGHFETAVGEALGLDLDAGEGEGSGGVGGHVSYIEV